jgi:ketosteroid isomerase-like protein
MYSRDVTLPAIVERYLDAYNRKDVEALVDCVADSVVFENVSNSGESIKIEGRDAFGELAARSAAMFERRNVVVKTAVVGVDSIALEVRWTATPSVDLGPMKAGVEVTMRAASFMTIANGRLQRIMDLS